MLELWSYLYQERNYRESSRDFYVASHPVGKGSKYQAAPIIPYLKKLEINFLEIFEVRIWVSDRWLTSDTFPSPTWGIETNILFRKDLRCKENFLSYGQDINQSFKCNNYSPK
ncbi:hypothetical protein AVEN_103083-1 [Araneus ventricosus]|uniref:Uncharacterized protein n=1 Tax=Araneus ventricosus TaxID=182803 RepID=A0A4Y2BAZ0_ARAVE|nr:hypothetical protein AVEN_103083-1 [Araneus ventricosus]